MKQMLSIQKAFEAKYGGRQGILGIGIGRSKNGDDLAINVYVANHKIADTLPKQLEGADVVYDVVGEFSGS